MTAGLDGDAQCRCGSGAAYGTCCGPVVEGEHDAVTAEALMRSRFSAFALGRVEHLRRSWDSTTVPAVITIDPDRRWTTLEIIDTQHGGALASEGAVEFVAAYDHGGRSGELRERSRFRRVGGRWVYVGPA